MLINGYRIVNQDKEGIFRVEYTFSLFKQELESNNEKMELHTGTYDRNQNPIFEGDLLRSKTCETPFKVENTVEFLLMCGRYEEKNGTPIFDSLEIVKE